MKHLYCLLISAGIAVLGLFFLAPRAYAQGPNCGDTLTLSAAGSPAGTYNILGGNNADGWDIEFQSQLNGGTGKHQIDYVFKLNGVTSYVYIWFTSQSGFSPGISPAVRVWAPAWSGTVYSSNSWPPSSPKYRGQGFTINSNTSMTMTVHVDIPGCAGYGYTMPLCDGTVEFRPLSHYFGDSVEIFQDQVTFDGEHTTPGTFYRVDYGAYIGGVLSNVFITFVSQSNYTARSGADPGVRIWDEDSALIYSNDTFPQGQTFEAAFFAIESDTDFSFTLQIQITQECIFGIPCDAVTDADFTTGDGWTLYGSAAITNSLLILSAVDYATQPITFTLPPNINYDVVMTATGVTSETNSIMVEFVTAGTTSTLTITDTATYTTMLASGPTTEILRLIGISGTVEIDFICLYPNLLFIGQYGDCLNNIIPNGEFDTPDEWVFVNGAAHNDVGQNAWIPSVISGTWENYSLAVVGRPTLNGIPPLLNPGEYLILQFDARAVGDGDGLITALYRNNSLTNTVELTYTFGTYAEYYTFQTDFSYLAGDTSDIEIGFYNDSYLVTQTNGVFFDNVCLFVSTTPMTVPVIAPGYFYSPLWGVNCANVSEWLSDTIGIDFPALEQMETPSIWDVDQWVPWLASKLWIYAAKPIICILLALLDNLVGTNFLNWLAWFTRQPNRIFAWFSDWFAPFLLSLGSWLLWFTSPLLSLINLILWFSGNFGEVLTWSGTVVSWLWDVLVALLLWFTSPLLSLINLILWFLGNSGEVLTWSGTVVSWLWDILVALFFWIIGHWIGWAMTILNTLITAWNILLPFVSAALSEMVEVGVFIWNMLAPFLSRIGGVWEFILFLISQVGVIGELIIFFFQVIWQFALMIWEGLKGAETLPIQFYSTFNNSVNDAEFELIPLCTGDMSNKWCVILAGLEVVDQAIAHSVGYPLVIVGIIVGTIAIFWRHIWELLDFKYR